ncbi:hypothetical protein [Plantactinospora sp. B24E8]|uniref:hypothetical protein n=1 Tax=Plantactinospora sp. B24E8 TaxID=3153567 RepID=UPI00325E1D73
MEKKQAPEAVRPDHTVVGAGYPLGELARALGTATGHPDPDTRQRAGRRVRDWVRVLTGMTSGRLRIGSRTPVAGLPAWVTPQVVHGGFATGKALAGGPLRPDEVDLARRFHLPERRADLFAHHLGEAGLAELDALLDSGRYRVEVPEEAALPVLVWLLRAGDEDAALELLREIAPYAHRLRFAPAPDDTPAPEPEIVWRATTGEIRSSLAGRGPDPRIEAMREALTVWNPFADDLLTLWLQTRRDGRVGAEYDPRWLARARALLDRYRVLAAAHPHCGKHRRPKENLAILRTALAEVTGAGDLTPRTRGLLQHAVDSMLRRRGDPGSAAYTRLRERQAVQAAVPGHHTVAQVVADRLADLPQRTGIRALGPVLRPVDAAEAAAAGIPAGTPVPEPVSRTVRRALAATVPDLVAAGVVPSAEVLASLVPRIAVAATAGAYPDPALRSVMAANYLAFRARRSLLLLNLEHQVRLTELPWVRAVAAHRDTTDETCSDAWATLRRLGEFALTGFPATILPNPLLRELDALSREAGVPLPWVEELAADIFEGRFSTKFLRAAKIAAEHLDGSLYARYYGIDYAAVLRIPDPSPGRGGGGTATSVAFDTLCRERAAVDGRGWSVAANGTVIEQAQILTTQNLATLAHRVGVRPADGWSTLARRTFAQVLVLAGRLPGNPRPLPMIKNIGYAWRQLVCYLSLPGGDDPRTVVDGLWEDLRAAPEPARNLLTPVLAGLGYVAAGGGFAPDGTGGAGRRLLGWTVGRHWLVADQDRPGRA